MLLIFDTHPIQYRSPVFRELYAAHNQVKVYFFNAQFDASHWWFNEIGQIPKQNWKLPLLEGFPNETLATNELGIFRSVAAIRRVLKKAKPSAVLIYGYYQWEHWILRLLTAAMGIPLVFVGETFSDTTSGTRKLVKKPLLNWFFSGVDHFITIGAKTRRFYLGKGIPENLLTDAKYCTDNTFFQVSADEAANLRREWRKTHGIPEEALVQLFVGRLVERKRPFDVLKIHSLLQSHENFYTAIAGNGLLEAELKNQAPDRFLMLGFQDQKAVRACYYGADFLIVPSEFESWGLVVNEAFSCGLPALVTDACGVSGDLVLDGKTGYSFAVGDTAKAAKLVERLLHDRSKLLELSRAAKQKVTSEYSITQFAQAIMRSLQQVSVG